MCNICENKDSCWCCSIRYNMEFKAAIKKALEVNIDFDSLFLPDQVEELSDNLNAELKRYLRNMEELK